MFNINYVDKCREDYDAYLKTLPKDIGSLFNKMEKDLSSNDFETVSKACSFIHGATYNGGIPFVQLQSLKRLANTKVRKLLPEDFLYLYDMIVKTSGQEMSEDDLIYTIIGHYAVIPSEVEECVLGALILYNSVGKPHTYQELFNIAKWVYHPSRLHINDSFTLKETWNNISRHIFNNNLKSAYKEYLLNNNT